MEQNIKWVTPEKWHITLKFLGDTGKNKIPIIQECLKFVQQQFTPFDIYFTSIGGFPDLNYPRVLYLGLKNKQPAVRIYNSLADMLAKKGFTKEDKSYIPHLTFARSRNRTDNKMLGRKVKEVTGKHFLRIFMRAKKISLIKSELHSSGPKYVNLYSINLNKT